jgi:linoleoyl-CoA desaturase
MLTTLVLSPYFVFGDRVHVAEALIIATFAGGFCATCLVAIGHVNRELDYDDPPQRDWTRHIVATTVAFSTKSRFIAWITGGLSLHVTHHLRPNDSRDELRSVHLQLRDTRQAGQVIELPSFWAALRGHYAQLKALGRPT